jgi:hypothetical protein
MGRTFGQVYVTIWDDPEFIARSSLAQRVYVMLFSQRKTSMVGCIDYMPRRWARYAPDTTEDDIEKAVQELADYRFVLLDRDTDELLVRTVVRRDGVRLTANSKLLRGLWSAWDAIQSPMLRQVVVDHMPDAVWDSKRTAPPAEALAMRAGYPQPEPPEPADRTAGSNRRMEPADLPATATPPASEKPWSHGMEPADLTGGSIRGMDPRGRARSTGNCPPSTGQEPSSQSSVTATGDPDDRRDDDDRWPEANETDGRVQAAARILGQRDHDAVIADLGTAHVRVPKRHLAGCVDRWLASGDLADLAERYPDLTPEQLADHLDPDTNPWLAAAGAVPADHHRAAQGPVDCDACADSSGWFELADRSAARCQHDGTVMLADGTITPYTASPPRPALRVVPDLPGSGPVSAQDAPDGPATGDDTPETVSGPHRAAQRPNAGSAS